MIFARMSVPFTLAARTSGHAVNTPRASVARYVAAIAAGDAHEYAPHVVGVGHVPRAYGHEAPTGLHLAGVHHFVHGMILAWGYDIRGHFRALF